MLNPVPANPAEVFLTIAYGAIQRSANILVGFQQKRHHLASAQVKKSDQTLLTEADTTIGLVLKEFIEQQLPWAAGSVEDTDPSIKKGAVRFKVFADPLDGTNAFVSGLNTSTLIAALYDNGEKQVVVTIICEPATGRIWYNSPETGKCHERHIQRDGRVINEAICAVSPSEFTEKSTIFLDVNHGFTRDGRQILTHLDMARLMYRLSSTCKVLIPGSNGLIHALVAAGYENACGGITTAIGGYWDVAGIKLVLSAGGVARAFSIDEDKYLTEKDPLDVTSYDIVVFGNSVNTVDKLQSLLHEATA